MDALVELWKEIGNAQELANNLNNDDAEACSFKRPDALALKRRLLLLASDMLEGGGGAGPNTAASSTLNPAGVGAAGAAGAAAAAGAGAGAGGVAYPLPEVTIVADREVLLPVTNRRSARDQPSQCPWPTVAVPRPT
eukprot:153642-Rhodomonas_salina.1